MTPRFGLIVPLVLLAGMSACGPVPVEQAERTCLNDARLAERPRGNIVLGVGAGSNGVKPVGRVELDVSSDYLMGRDPAEVYQSCVLRRSGQLPGRPLYDQPAG